MNRRISMHIKRRFTPTALLLHSCQLVTCLLFTWLVIPSCNGPAGGRVQEGATYYISLEGNDSNPGTSLSRPWQSIQRVNEQKFSPGDRILFRSGDTFNGTFTLSAEDAGRAESRLIVSSFGEGTATISGNEAEGLKADSCHFLTIENLEFSGLGRISGNTTDGLFILQCKDIILNDLDVHGFQHSGVHLHQCNDAVIAHVYAHENGFAGIHVTGNTIWDTARYDNHNLYIGYCKAENNPGDPTVLNNHSGNGILASSVNGGTIEYCEASNNGWDMPWTGNGPVGIWIWDCTDFTIQNCIAHHNRTNPSAADGGGFDLDGGVSNSVIQYCISHNNEGAGYGLYEFGAAKPWENNTIRYNISQDDGIINGGSLGIWKSDNVGVMRNCQVYNNTFYNSLKDGSSIWLYDNYPGFSFYNNVFVYNGELISEEQRLKDEIFIGNLYWNLAEEEAFFDYANLNEWATATGNEMLEDQFIGLYMDPLFSHAGSIEVTDPTLISPESIGGFIPQAGSPLVDRGLNLKDLLNLDTGERDLPGTSIPSKNSYDIGAIELDY